MGQSRGPGPGTPPIPPGAGAFMSHLCIRAALMPTNLPDRRKQEVQASEDFLLDVMVAVLAVGMFIAAVLTSFLP